MCSLSISLTYLSLGVTLIKEYTVTICYIQDKLVTSSLRKLLIIETAQLACYRDSY